MSEANHNESARLDHIRSVVDTLAHLLEILNPEPGADIFTLDDFRFRYRLTELGAPAMRAIEQSQRINRALGDYLQIGLCEFHIGLIYLYSGDCRGAEQQYAKAQRQWSFIHKNAFVSLAHFAEGNARHLAYHYEAAMVHYGQAEELLPRIQLAPPSDNRGEFVVMLTEALTAAQQTLRNEMWSPPAPAGRPEETGEVAQAEVEPGVPAPISNLNADPQQPGSPVPAHKNVNDKFIWYEVNKRERDFLPDVNHGAWLLVNTQTTGHEFKQDELVVVIREDDVEGSIVLKPRAQQQPFWRIYLACSQFEGSFTLNKETGKIALSSNRKQISVNQDEILGVVVGFWLQFSDSAQEGGANE